MSELRTRIPSGRPGWPLVLVDHETDAGGTYLSLALSNSARVDRMFVVDFDGTADAYADLGPFELLDHNGTLEDVEAQIGLASIERPCTDIIPNAVNVLVIDNVSTLWPAVVGWGDARSRSARSASLAEQRKPQLHPGAEQRIPENVWADIRARWRHFIDVCRAFPGPVIWVARGEARDNDEWRTQVEPNLAREASVWVRVTRTPREAWLVGCELLTGPRTVPVQLAEHDALADLLFDQLEPEDGYQDRWRTTAASTGFSRMAAKQKLIDVVKEQLRLSKDESVDEAERLWTMSGLNEFGAITLEQWDDLVALVGTPPEEPADAVDGESPPVDDAGESSTTVDEPAEGEQQDAQPAASPADDPEDEAA